MPFVCPDPGILTAWRDAMLVTGVSLLLVASIAIPLLLRARPASWRARSLSAISAALDIGVGAASLVLAYQLNGAFAVVARWFAYYPRVCGPLPRSWPYRGYLAAVDGALRQAVEPLERAAQLDLALAVVAVAALVACALVWGGKRRARMGRVR